jgi:hypothetical protein
VGHESWVCFVHIIFRFGLADILIVLCVVSITISSGRAHLLLILDCMGGCMVGGIDRVGMAFVRSFPNQGRECYRYIPLVYIEMRRR